MMHHRNLIYKNKNKNTRSRKKLCELLENMPHNWGFSAEWTPNASHDFQKKIFIFSFKNKATKTHKHCELYRH